MDGVWYIIDIMPLVVVLSVFL